MLHSINTNFHKENVLAGLAIVALTLTGCAAAEEEVADTVDETDAPMSVNS